MTDAASPVRVRFAPAPSGFLHVGSARAALFNWMFARHTGGVFVLRIEDTDPERSRDDLVEGIERSLRWLGLDWDEGPVRQSQRMDRYAEAAGRLVSGGFAYYCDCTRDEVDARHVEGRPQGYDGHCRDRGLAPGEATALRFRVPDDGQSVVHDLIRGDVVFEHASIEDFVVRRTDGSPMFVLANAVDDADMGITHVLRGEDLLPSTPKVLLIRRALGVDDDPAYAHLPVIVNEKRQKLSKRRDDVAVEEYRERGYLPDALRNYLALLGWAPADGREILPIEEMIAQFRIEDVKSSPAFFDVTKLDHVNGEYIRALPVDRFVADSLPWLEDDPPWPPERFDLRRFESIAALVQERVKVLSEVPTMIDFLFVDQPSIDPASWDKAVGRVAAAPAVLRDAESAFATCEWSASELHAVVTRIGESHGLKLAKAQAPIRVAVTGRTVGPPLFESLALLGRDTSRRRVAAAADRADAQAAEVDTTDRPEVAGGP